MSVATWGDSAVGWGDSEWSWSGQSLSPAPPSPPPSGGQALAESSGETGGYLVPREQVGQDPNYPRTGNRWSSSMMPGDDAIIEQAKRRRRTLALALAIIGRRVP